MNEENNGNNKKELDIKLRIKSNKAHQVFLQKKLYITNMGVKIIFSAFLANYHNYIFFAQFIILNLTV